MAYCKQCGRKLNSMFKQFCDEDCYGEYMLEVENCECNEDEKGEQ